MRQGNGTDLLGVNDPRSASIGVIYVATNDDRKSVLAAIITQDKLGRKQVAVVLPQSNKAFQRPVDFDDLRSWRRKLHTQIVFIAPSGSGAAEHARRLRFPVYSSLETYTKSLNEGEAAEKKHWLFGAVGPKPKPKPPAKDDQPAIQDISIADTPRNATESPSVGSPPLRGPAVPSEDEYEDEAPISYARGARSTSNNGAAFLGGAALGAAAAQAANHSGDGDDTQDVRAHRLSRDEDGDSMEHDNEDEDWAIAPQRQSPPTTPATNNATQKMPDDTPDRRTRPPTNGNPPPPTPIELPVKPRNTAKLAGTPAAEQANSIAGKQKNSGKLGAIGMALGSAAATQRAAEEMARSQQGSIKVTQGTSSVGSPSPKGNAAGKGNAVGAAGVAGAAALAATAGQRGTAGATRGGAAGGMPPTRPTRPGGGGPPRRQGRRRRWWILALIALIVLLIGGIGYALAFAAPGGGLKNPLTLLPKATPPAQVTITPDTKLIANNYVIPAVLTNPDPAAHQVQARQITSQAQSQPKTVNSTGHNQTAGLKAHGTLTFFNGSASGFTVAAGTTLQNGDGIQVSTDT
ncbi:MAG TPA: hypothetical protein VKR06_32915, partial [Ktedonosporobacter sp.]|nr:hypothetical protein [Ktedonosporobacter sp.]